jgi:hypothetical protein
VKTIQEKPDEIKRVIKAGIKANHYIRGNIFINLQPLHNELDGRCVENKDREQTRNKFLHGTRRYCCVMPNFVSCSN